MAFQHLQTGKIPIQTLFQYIKQALLPVLQDTQECKAITKRILSDYLQCRSLDLTLNKSIDLTTDTIQALNDIISRLHQNEPIQYILGKAPFMDRDFQVSPAVLIPRPETEEMVDAILKANNFNHTSILDIGTGSGCIAITLKKAWPDATVTALEISSQALAIATTNAHTWQADIHWIQGDLFDNPLPNQQWDLIASNPPYVRQLEKEQMHARVYQYEPSTALFVKDDNPLVFYEAIIALIPQHLKSNGKIYLEINEAFGYAVAELLEKAGLIGVQVHKDLQGKDRWVVATKYTV